MKQVWKSFTIRCDSEEIAKRTEVSLFRASNVKDVSRESNVVKYKQLNWEYENESTDD